jgi:hypothetical protein
MRQQIFGDLQPHKARRPAGVATTAEVHTICISTLPMAGNWKLHIKNGLEGMISVASFTEIRQLYENVLGETHMDMIRV